jgi:membrane fusion protein (multidrug efflux system)
MPSGGGGGVIVQAKWLRSWAALAVVSALAASCSKGGGGFAFPPPEVSVVTLAPRTVPQAFEFPGQAQPYRSVEVRSRVDGIILERPFTEGMIVRAGQVLYRLDKVRYQAAYDAALARFQNAKATYERLEPLVAQHAVAQQDVDNAQASYTAAQAALEAARKDLEDTDVKAEITGRVGRTRMEVGARVTGSADLLTTIDQLDPVYVSFQPSSQQMLEWRENLRWRELIQPGTSLTVRVVLPDGSLLPSVGRLDFVAPSLDAATGTQEFRATFRNADRLLTPGEFVRVRLLGFERDSAFAIPQRAVQTGLGRQFVYVVSDGDTVRIRDVQTGPWSDGEWIIDHGLGTGDRVIVDGLQKAVPGRPVKPVALSDGAAAPAAPQAPGAGSAP